MVTKHLPIFYAYSRQYAQIFKNYYQKNKGHLFY